jgi:hypothetical protein
MMMAHGTQHFCVCRLVDHYEILVMICTLLPTVLAFAGSSLNRNLNLDRTAADGPLLRLHRAFVVLFSSINRSNPSFYDSYILSRE